MNGVLFAFTHDGAAVHFAGAAFLLAGMLTLLSLAPFMRGVAVNRDAIPSSAE
jgi:DHA1 family tetracycline resistance protein-like MFS transporter